MRQGEPVERMFFLVRGSLRSGHLLSSGFSRYVSETVSFLPGQHLKDALYCVWRSDVSEKLGVTLAWLSVACSEREPQQLHELLDLGL